MFAAWLPIAAASSFDGRHPWAISSLVGQLGPICIPRPPLCGRGSGLLYGKLKFFKADIVELKAEFQAITESSISPATSYTSGVRGYEGWALLSSDGSVSDGVSYIRANRRDPFRSPTPALKKGGAFDKLLQDLEAINLQPERVRLMSLNRDFQWGQGMDWHRDPNPTGGQRWRVHVPILTTPDAFMEWQPDWDFDPIQSHHRLHMPANGSAWATRVDLMHRATVSSKSKHSTKSGLPSERVHLIMDVVSDALNLEDAHPVCSCGEVWKVQAEASDSGVCEGLPQVVVHLKNRDVSALPAPGTGLLCQAGMVNVQQGQLRVHVEFGKPGRWASQLRQLWFDPTGANWTRHLDLQPNKHWSEATFGSQEEPLMPGPWRLMVALGSVILAEATFTVLPRDVKSEWQSWEKSHWETGYIDLNAPVRAVAGNRSFQVQSNWPCMANSNDFGDSHRICMNSCRLSAVQSSILHGSEIQFLSGLEPLRDSVIVIAARLPANIGHVWNAPCIAVDGTGVAASSDGIVYAFSSQTGESLWQAQPNRFIGSSLFCAQAIGIAYVSYITASGWSGIAALKLDDGGIVWHHDAIVRGRRLSMVTVDYGANILLTIATDGCVFAYTANLGLHLWNRCIAARIHTPILKIRTALGVAVFAAADGSIFCITMRDGSIRWSIPSSVRRLIPQPALAPASLGLLGRAAPVIFAVTWAGTVVAIDVLTGEWLWQRQFFKRLQGDLLVVSQLKGPTLVLARTAGGDAYGIDAEIGKVLWTSSPQENKS